MPAFFTPDRTALLPPIVHQLLLSGAWLCGNRARPESNWETMANDDWDLCIEPQNYSRCAMLLSAVNAEAIRFTRFGGTRYSIRGPHTIVFLVDVWVSPIGEMMANLPYMTSYMASLTTGAYLTVCKNAG